MRSRDLSRFALSICALVVMLAGCGGSQPPIGASGELPQAPVLATRPHGTNYKVAYSFGAQPDGIHPDASLIDIGGTLYGTTAQGGTNSCGSDGCGTVFTITTSGSGKVLYSFGVAPDGNTSRASLLDVDGALYGTTSYGGKNTCSYGCGTVFRVTTGGTEKVLYSFGARPDGSNSTAGLIDMDGTLYGTTTDGGLNKCSGYDGCGTIFTITMSGKEHALHDFEGPPDGADPAANLIDVRGTLYGTTYAGGAHHGGTVFRIGPDGKLKVLHSFGSGNDGKFPFAGLIESEGLLYGTTTEGGAGSCIGSGSRYVGCGTVFSITPSGTEKVLHYFSNGSSGDDGQYPLAGLVKVKGAFYGTTYGSGEGGSQCCGTLFRITRDGSEKVLHSFGSGTGTDGLYPEAGLINVNGTLYGTTTYGGTHNNGTVFALTI